MNLIIQKQHHDIDSIETQCNSLFYYYLLLCNASQIELALKSPNKTKVIIILNSPGVTRVIVHFLKYKSS